MSPNTPMIYYLAQALDYLPQCDESEDTRLHIEHLLYSLVSPITLPEKIDNVIPGDATLSLS